ncbi:efflux RND transporter periplasmic adaptor subunit [Marilutibacter alkalisoli]|uniref:Efflux RND transporter periplasmic adaptor subunit n=1 Tax=Marilutibacter alkalisoli TaxID=2591633 RepID=A0A514BV93_9GAMM|nr:efflux RND transporter periplasmic adaptor subunit [Lysobacter alkalisoli]QDH71235.1 efflux RND transporter periplasmic adaptor subunit [Lysobacter alkalisoli]
MNPAIRPLIHSSVTTLLAAALAACAPGGDTASGIRAGAASTDVAGDHDADGHDDDHGDTHDDDGDSTRIPAAIAAASGIRVAPVAPGTIADEHGIQGLLIPVDGRTADVMARYPGPVRALHARVGDRVRAGQSLAVIESNLSLSTYTITAPIAGVVMARPATIGAVATEGTPLFEIADLSELWVDLHVFGADAQHIAVGSPVTVARMSDDVRVDTVLERILPGTATASQSTVARATIANADGLWRPGSAVRARVTVERFEAARVVPLSALQREGGDDVVYVRDGDTFRARRVRLGRRDAERAEILDGIETGEQVVVAQSFLVKADIGKSSATHAH